MVKNIIKHINLYQRATIIPVEDKNVADKNKAENTKEMTEEQLTKMEGLIDQVNNKGVKKVKKDKSLIERTESSKIILTEDNRQVLTD